MKTPKLFMTLIGCDVPGRNTEQHDIFFGIGYEIKDLVPQIKAFWPEAIKPHLDAWREVNKVDEYRITVVERSASGGSALDVQLFFLNLGGYKKDEFDEYHYRMLAVAGDKGEAIKKSKQTAFYKHVGYPGATSHVDDKYGVAVDEVMEIKDILSKELIDKYRILIEPVAEEIEEDAVNLGYFLLDKGFQKITFILWVFLGVVV